MKLADIHNVVSHYFNVDYDRTNSIINKDRNTKYIDVRRFTYFYAKKYTKLSLADIGSFYGQDHATVLNAVKKMNIWITNDKKYIKTNKLLYLKIAQINKTNKENQSLDLLKHFKRLEKIINAMLHFENKKTKIKSELDLNKYDRKLQHDFVIQKMCVERMNVLYINTLFKY